MQPDRVLVVFGVELDSISEMVGREREAVCVERKSGLVGEVRPPCFEANHLEEGVIVLVYHNRVFGNELETDNYFGQLHSYKAFGCMAYWH